MRTSFSMPLFLLLCSCASQPRQAPVSELALRSGECVAVHFTNRSGPEVRQVIDRAGDISLPFVGKLHVAGMTPQQVEREILAAYQPIERPLEVSVVRSP
jgi:protein involved in polysaccharide export with SLBB domain